MATKRKTENNLGISASGGAAPARRKTASKPRKKPVATPELAAVPEPDDVPQTAEAAIAVPSVPEPSREAIAELAYSFWLSRGCQGGSDQEDWLRAEQQLRLGR